MAGHAVCSDEGAGGVVDDGGRLSSSRGRGVRSIQPRKSLVAVAKVQEAYVPNDSRQITNALRIVPEAKSHKLAPDNLDQPEMETTVPRFFTKFWSGPDGGERNFVPEPRPLLVLSPRGRVCAPDVDRRSIGFSAR